MGEQDFETINKLFLELSQVVSSETITFRETGMRRTLERVKQILTSATEQDSGGNWQFDFMDARASMIRAINVIDGLDV